MSRKGGLTYRLGMSLLEDSCPIRVEPENRAEADAGVIILKHGLSSSEHTDKGI